MLGPSPNSFTTDPKPAFTFIKLIPGAGDVQCLVLHLGFVVGEEPHCVAICST